MRHGLRRYAGLLVIFACLWVSATASAQMFPQSVASGDPRPDSVVLWTRVVPADPGGMPRSLDLEVAADVAFQDVVISRNVDVDPAYDGVDGNLSQDPLFVNPATGDYHLGPGSPALDTGDPSGVPPAPPVDYDGQTRPLGNGVDIGADEES